LSDNAFMSLQVAAGETDDPQFITLLNSLVRGLTEEETPQEVWIIQIDNWFDHKWLGFGMNKIVPIEEPEFPPFTPNRVVCQFSYVRVGNGYEESPLPVLPHSTKRKRSEMNLRKCVQDFTRSASFVWYSGNTRANGRGSVMVYHIVADRFEYWFAGFNRQRAWTLHSTKGVSRGDVLQLLGMRSS
jgi:hypothetical protein